MNTYQSDMADIIGSADGNDWAMPRVALAELASRLDLLRPGAVLELGSGRSSQIIHSYAYRTGAAALTLEHQHRYLLTSGLAVAGYTPLHQQQALVHAPLVPSAHPSGAPMYDLDVIPPEFRGMRFDFVLIDGPPLGAGGRAATVPALAAAGMLADGVEVWLDDAVRDSELAALAQWSADGTAVVRETTPIGHGIARLTLESRHHADHPRVDATDVVITLLTGGRPDLLDETLSSIDLRAPGLLESATIVALNNGNCDRSRDVLYRHGIDGMDLSRALVVASDELMHPGPAYSMLVDLLGYVDNEYWLHLEDDWTLATLTPGWLDHARAILDERPEIAQVRLRAVCEPTRTAHMVTGAPIIERWDLRAHSAVSSTAHLTMNPSLMRTSDASKLVPCPGERGMQRRAHAAGLTTVAQLVPGAFIHGGEGRSLRLATGGPA